MTDNSSIKILREYAGLLDVEVGDKSFVRQFLGITNAKAFDNRLERASHEYFQREFREGRNRIYFNGADLIANLVQDRLARVFPSDNDMVPEIAKWAIDNIVGGEHLTKAHCVITVMDGGRLKPKFYKHGLQHDKEDAPVDRPFVLTDLSVVLPIGPMVNMLAMNLMRERHPELLQW